MPRVSGLTEADIERRWRRVVELSHRGVPVAEIASQLGISQTHVYRIRAQRIGAKTPRRNLSAEEIATAQRLLDEGASYAEVARTLGRERSVIRRRFPGCGWTPQQGSDHAAWLRQFRRDLLHP